jgi:hypothetical protein
MNEVMLSYRRDDSADITGRIYDRLVESFGGEAIFKDIDSIPLGANFKQHLDEVVSQCHALVVVIGRNWLGTASTDGSRRLDDPQDVVRLEIEAALERRIPVVPLLVQGASMPDATTLPLTLRELVLCNGTTIGHDPQFHSDIDRLIRNLETIVSAAPLRQPLAERIRRAQTRRRGEAVKSRKGPVTAIVVGASLSVGASYFFYLTLGEPLTAQEMFFTVVVSSLVVFVAQRLLYRRLMTKVDEER